MRGAEKKKKSFFPDVNNNSARPSNLPQEKANLRHGAETSNRFPQIAGSKGKSKCRDFPYNQEYNSTGTRFPPLIKASTGGKATGRRLVEGQHCIQTVFPALVKEPGAYSKRQERVNRLSDLKQPDLKRGVRKPCKVRNEVVFHNVEILMPSHLCGPKLEASLRWRHLIHREPLLARRAALQKEESRAMRPAPLRPDQLPKLSQNRVPLVCQGKAMTSARGARQAPSGLLSSSSPRALDRMF